MANDLRKSRFTLFAKHGQHLGTTATDTRG